MKKEHPFWGVLHPFWWLLALIIGGLIGFFLTGWLTGTTWIDTLAGSGIGIAIAGVVNQLLRKRKS
jgi:divalent metal cation (Fe/Co/Zn/Cd) transporter